MATFLSPEWVAAFNQAVAGADIPEAPADAPLATRAGSFSVAQIVSGGPQGEVATTLTVEGGRVHMRSGKSDDATVTVALAWDDAVAMASGTLAATAALAAGRIRVRGDSGVLVAGQGILAGLHPCLQNLNETTTY